MQLVTQAGAQVSPSLALGSGSPGVGPVTQVFNLYAFLHIKLELWDDLRLYSESTMLYEQVLNSVETQVTVKVSLEAVTRIVC